MGKTVLVSEDSAGRVWTREYIEFLAKDTAEAVAEPNLIDEAERFYAALLGFEEASSD